MITPLIIFTLLIVPYLTFSFMCTYLDNPKLGRLGGVVGLSMAFIFFGIGHFIMNEEMNRMLPEWLPNTVTLVYLTGILEFSLALALLAPALRRVAGCICVLALVGFFPRMFMQQSTTLILVGMHGDPFTLLSGLRCRSC